jgi:hypothetical protein
MRGIFERLGRLLLLVGYAALGGASVAFLGGGACIVTSGCDDDDDDDGDLDDDDDDCYDDDDDDDDGTTTATAAGPEAYRLRSFELVASEEPGAHPVRRLERIEGPSLFAAFGPGDYGARDLAAFTAAVRAANAELLELPPESGRLVLREVRYLCPSALVRWAQLPPGAEEAGAALDGAGQAFLVDGHGRLVAIDNTTRLRPAEAAPPR